MVVIVLLFIVRGGKNAPEFPPLLRTTCQDDEIRFVIYFKKYLFSLIIFLYSGAKKGRISLISEPYHAGLNS